MLVTSGHVEPWSTEDDPEDDESDEHVLLLSAVEKSIHRRSKPTIATPFHSPLPPLQILSYLGNLKSQEGDVIFV